MSHDIEWSKQRMEKFIDYALLNEEETYIIRSRIMNTPVSEQAYILNCSESRVHRIIAKLKRKYDIIQEEYPDEFPKRKNSAKEEYMDEN